ncbi:capsule assembly Wzi family protein [Colwellia ponticola]|uniref:Capsule assembly Wzi family protein n=1 Tax=Colwellia ponticola TaxID=2304625 RepID=A0A8H2JNP4_9GAMM|nr:capsule assembly Wzi family protein [Colwellia ponticola]TMM47532.1 capsule assembly Wzi family protein [Colwellia ponticola]
MKFFKLPCLLLCFVNMTSFAKGPSPYLPLQTDPLIELELNRLATLAKLPVLTKPYHAATVNRYLKKVAYSHPSLYKRISTYLQRYKKEAAVTHVAVQINYSDTENITLPNQRGQMIDANYQASFSGFWQINQYLILNGGGKYYEDGGYVQTNSFISFGIDVLQVDVGYREHWISPFQDSAVLLSTQAKPPLSVTISNPSLITDFNLKYEISIGVLDEHTNISFDKDLPPISGEPALLTMHFSAQPFNWWTIGFNRTLMFGGDDNVTGRDIWNAIIDPVNSDNCGGNGTQLQNCSEEFGNQQASISNRFDLDLFDMPFSLFYEYAGEDTNNYTNHKLANLANSFGLFLPYLTDNVSLNMEFTTFQSAWYTHHIYGEGYSNDGVKMGHWWGSMKDPKDGVGGEAGSVRLDWQSSEESQVSMLYRTANFNKSSYENYQRSHELELNYTRVIDANFLGVKLYLGRNNYSNNFVRTSISYSW